jgi:hypothetical protein
MYKRGFTLFFALLVASLAISIGLAIYDLTERQIDLSSTVTQSQYAIFAADTGVECALYWDNQYKDGSGNPLNGSVPSAFATSTADTAYAHQNGGLDCNGTDITSAASSWSLTPAASAATTTFTLAYPPQPYCALITVFKNGNPSQTVITAHGYNVGDSTHGCVATTGALQLERILQVTY